MSHFVGVVVGEDYESEIEPFWELDLSTEDAKCDDRAEFECQVEEKDIPAECQKIVKEMIKDDKRKLKSAIQMLQLIKGKHFSAALKAKWGEGSWRLEDVLKEPAEKIKNIAIAECKDSMEELFKDGKVSEFTEALAKKDYETILDYYYGGGFDENGDWGYWSNPNARWDWASVGGRWKGFFKLKKGVKGGYSEKKYKGKADIARIKDIDWEGMDKEMLKNAEKWWKDYEDAIKAGKVNEGEPYYQSGVRKGDTKEKFLAREGCWKPFCVVMNGEWYERGTMGWWGVVHDEKEEETWDKEWKELIKELVPNTILTAVDFHI